MTRWQFGPKKGLNYTALLPLSMKLYSDPNSMTPIPVAVPRCHLLPR